MRRRWIEELRGIIPKLAGTLGASGIAAVVGLAGGTIAARVLEPSGRGDLAQLLLWPQLVVTAGNLGIELAAVYLSGDPARRRNVPATTLAVAMAQSLILVPAYLMLVPLVYAGSGVTREAMLMTPLIPMYLIGAVSIDVLAGRLRFGAFNAVRLTLPVLYCGAVVALAASGHLTPLTGALGYLAAHAIADVLALALVWRENGLGRVDRALAREAVAFGARSHFGRLSPQSLGIDTAVIALMLSSHDLGLYAAATAFLAAPNLFASAVGMVVYPHVSASHQAGERPRVAATFVLHAATIVVLALMLVVLAGPLVSVLFGDSYTGATPALRLLAIGAVAASIRAFPIEVLRGVGRPGLTSIAEAANWLLFAIAIPIGASAGGLLGVAAAVTAANWGSLAVLTILVFGGRITARARPRARRKLEAAEATA